MLVSPLRALGRGFSQGLGGRQKCMAHIGVPALVRVFLANSLFHVSSSAPYAACPAEDDAASAGVDSQTSLATFAAGCFWSVELAFQRKHGVLRTAVGYTQGHIEEPNYRQVVTGTTGHVEAVQLSFDPNIVSYGELLRVFFNKHDPTTLNRQGNDRGSQYRSGIYFHDETQRQEALRAVEEEQTQRKNPIVTELLPATTFWPAEEYHQQYLEKGGQSAEKGDTTAIRCYG